MTFIRNKKTTVLGLSGIVCAIASFVVTKDVGSLATGLATSLGLILASDGGV